MEYQKELRIVHYTVLYTYIKVHTLCSNKFSIPAKQDDQKELHVNHHFYLQSAVNIKASGYIPSIHTCKYSGPYRLAQVCMIKTFQIALSFEKRLVTAHTQFQIILLQLIW